MAIATLRHFLIPGVGWSLSIATARAVAAEVDWLGVAACVVGVFAAYRLDDVLDSEGGPFATEARPEIAAIALAGAGLLGIALLQPSLFAPLSLLGALGVFYIPLKRFVPKNLLTASAWAVCVVTLSLDLDPFTREHSLATGMIFFLVLANASLCDLPDIEHDRKNRVVGLVVAVGPRTGGRLAAGIACIAMGIASVLGSLAFAIPAAIYIVLGGLFFDAVATHRKQRWLLDAVLLLPGPISLLG